MSLKRLNFSLIGTGPISQLVKVHNESVNWQWRVRQGISIKPCSPSKYHPQMPIRAPPSWAAMLRDGWQQPRQCKAALNGIGG